MPQHTVLHLIASRLNTIHNLSRFGVQPCHGPVLDRNLDEIYRIERTFMPSGSGFDSGSHIDLDRSTESRIVFNTAFHHMDDVGGYDGWTDHRVTFEATFTTPNVKVSGRNKRDIKGYIADTFMGHATQLVEEVWNPVAKEFLFHGPMGIVA